MTYNRLRVFTDNYNLDPTDKELPEEVEEHFRNFLTDPNTTVDDIIRLLKLLSHEESCEWDSIAHYFL